jgi:hypothetical protein
MDYGAFEYGGTQAVYAGTVANVAARAIRAGLAWLSNKMGSATTAPRPGTVS